MINPFFNKMLKHTHKKHAKKEKKETAQMHRCYTNVFGLRRVGLTVDDDTRAG